MADKKYIVNNRLILERWDHEENSALGLELESLTEGSHKKAAFVCPVCSTRYISIIRNVIRYDGGCPKCAEEKRVASFARTQLAKKPSLIQFNPDLASTEWDYNKNSEIGLYPDKIIYSSTKSAYWICEKGHSYLGRIDHRTIDKSGCPYCSNQKALAGYNDLQTQRPDLAKQWHPTKNAPLKPCDVVPFSNKKVWWLCELGHEWATSISHRAHGTNCPHCYSENGTSFPEQAIIFYLSKHIECINRHSIDGMEIDIYIPSQKIGFEYDGEIWHSSSKAKARESLKNEQFSRMGITLYRIKEADSFFYDETNKTFFCKPDRNYQYLSDVLTWISRVLGISVGTVCVKADQSAIYEQYVLGVKKNNIATEFPDIAKEWDYEKNGRLLPEYLKKNSNKVVWFKCAKCNSSYSASIYHRTNGTGCPFCAGKKVNETNSLSARYPEKVKFWDFTHNAEHPDNVYFGTHQKYSWICSNCQESFVSSVARRVQSKTDLCPKCMHIHIGTKLSENSGAKKGNSVADNPILLKEWHHSKNDISPDSVSQKSGKRVWWICSACNFEWEAQIYNRYAGTGCPRCRAKAQAESRGKKVVNLDTGMVFASVKEAAVSCKGSSANIVKCCKGEIKTAYGFRWRYI